jgi:hypothetical protein
MLHRTGPGKITVDGKYNGNGMIKAVLHNFDVDGDQPKPEHLNFLEQQAVPLLQNERGHIWMQGSASRSGTNAYNMALSKRRVRKVAAYLAGRGILAKQMQLDAVGEEMAIGHALEDEADRAVALLILPVKRDSPPPPPRPPKPRPVTDKFKIRMLAGLSASAGPAQTENLFFQIVDKDHGVTAFFHYGSLGLGKSVRLPLSGTMKGPWNDFLTSGPMEVSEFEGAARFTTAGAGPFTLNYLNMMGLPPGIATVPNPLSINTGFTIGLGVSTSVGKLTWIPREVMQYNGD